MQVDVIEKNPGGYLSAAEIPLSHLYIGMAGVFFTAAMVWVYILMKHRYSDYTAYTQDGMGHRLCAGLLI